jgi:hypothetical protein
MRSRKLGTVPFWGWWGGQSHAKETIAFKIRWVEQSTEGKYGLCIDTMEEKEIKGGKYKQ